MAILEHLSDEQVLTTALLVGVTFVENAAAVIAARNGKFLWLAFNSMPGDDVSAPRNRAARYALLALDRDGVINLSAITAGVTP